MTVESTEDNLSTAAPAPSSKRKMWWRVGALVALVLSTYAIAWGTGADEYFTLEQIRTNVEEWGPWGWAAYLALFSLGELIHIPGLVFVAASILVYGKLVGGLLGFVGSIVSVSVSFVVVRTVGGKPLAALPWKFAQRILSGLEERPIRTVFILRLIFFMAPLLNYALALSTLRFRDYVIGSFLGLIGPITVVVFLFDWILARFL